MNYKIIGQIILPIIVIIIVLYYKYNKLININRTKINESFICPCDGAPGGKDSDKFHLICTYERLNANKKEGTTISEPSKDLDGDKNLRLSRKNFAFLNAYLNSHLKEEDGEYVVNPDAKYGCGNGWSNIIPKRTMNKCVLCPEWLYYLYRNYISRDTITYKYNYNIINKIKNVDFLDYSNQPLLTQGKNNYFYNKTKQNVPDMIFCLFLDKIMKDRGDKFSSEYLWGIPRIKNNDNSLKYNYTVTGNNISKNLFINPDGNLKLENDKSSKFVIEITCKCQELYFYIKTKKDTESNEYYYLTKKSNNILGLASEPGLAGKGEALIFYFDLTRNVFNMEVELDSILSTPNKNKRTGEPVYLLAKNSSEENIFYVLHDNIDDIELKKIDGNIYSKYNIKYSYKYINNDLSKKLVATDKNSLKPIQFTFNREDLLVDDMFYFVNEGYIKDTTNKKLVKPADLEPKNRKLFDQLSDSDISAGDKKCTYTGILSDKKTIESVCEQKPDCYGEYVDNVFDSSGNRYAKAYIGKDCQQKLVYVDDYKETISDTVRRAAIDCNAIGNDLAKGVKECPMPKFSTNTKNVNRVWTGEKPDASAKLLSEGKKATCKENEDYGLLDTGFYDMFVNNPVCNGEYIYRGYELKGDGTCLSNQKCQLNKLNKEDEDYLLDNDFNVLINKNIELSNNLDYLTDKVNLYKKSVLKQTEKDKIYNQKLVDNLNDFKFTQLFDNMNRHNYMGYAEIMKQN